MKPTERWRTVKNLSGTVRTLIFKWMVGSAGEMDRCKILSDSVKIHTLISGRMNQKISMSAGLWSVPLYSAKRHADPEPGSGSQGQPSVSCSNSREWQHSSSEADLLLWVISGPVPRSGLQDRVTIFMCSVSDCECSSYYWQGSGAVCDSITWGQFICLTVGYSDPCCTLSLLFEPWVLSVEQQQDDGQSFYKSDTLLYFLRFSFWHVHISNPSFWTCWCCKTLHWPMFGFRNWWEKVYWPPAVWGSRLSLLKKSS